MDYLILFVDLRVICIFCEFIIGKVYGIVSVVVY